MKTRYQVPHPACGFSAVLLIAFLTVFTWAHTARCAESDAPKTETKSSTKEKSAPAATPKDQQAAAPGKKGEKKMEKNPIVVMETSMGPVEIELFADKAPVSVQNFLKYADEGFYNGTVFHRVIPDFMIQGGGFTEDLKQKPTHAPIKNEATNGLKNERGTLAMARTMVVDSATAQFFINVKDNPFLNHTAPNERGYGYAVFGKVLSGMDVVDKIKAVPTTTKGMYENVPVAPVTIKSVKRK